MDFLYPEVGKWDFDILRVGTTPSGQRYCGGFRPAITRGCAACLPMGKLLIGLFICF